MRPSDTAFRVRMLAALMQLCTIVVREVEVGRSSDLFVDPQETLLSWQPASASEVLAVECTCKHEPCTSIFDREYHLRLPWGPNLDEGDCDFMTMSDHKDNWPWQVPMQCSRGSLVFRCFVIGRRWQV